MLTLQQFGLLMETILSKYGPYIHKEKVYQDVFLKRYEILSKMDPEKDYHVERMLSQFFMSHNIATGMTINLIWVSVYLFVIARNIPDSLKQNVSSDVRYILDSNAVIDHDLAFILLLIITILSWYVSYNRFLVSCNVLYVHQNASQFGNNDLKYTKSVHTSQPAKISSLIIVSFILLSSSIGIFFNSFVEACLIGFGIGSVIFAKYRQTDKLSMPSISKYYPLTGLLLILMGILLVINEKFNKYLPFNIPLISDISDNFISIILCLVGIITTAYALIDSHPRNNIIRFQTKLSDFGK